MVSFEPQIQFINGDLTVEIHPNKKSKNGSNNNPNIIPGSTPLYIAAQEGHSEVVDLLLSRSADIECVFRDGYTPLYIAAQNGRVEVVKTLLVKGANREASCKYL